MAIDDGGAAFPQPLIEQGGMVLGACEYAHGGMSLRAYIATHVAASLNANPAISDGQASYLAGLAVNQADALIAALKGE